MVQNSSFVIQNLSFNQFISSSYITPRRANFNVDCDRCVSSVSLNSDLVPIASYHCNNHVKFNTSKALLLSFCLRSHSFSYLCH